MKEPNHDITPQEQMAEAMQAERPGEAQPAAPKEEKPSLWIECYTLLHDLVYILVFVTILFVFALRVVSVSGPSMYPTLVDRDYVALLSNVFYSGSDIQNGDVVVALAPRFDDEPIVKRVIPMNPRCESLNAAVAAAIVMWQMQTGRPGWRE